MMSVEHWLAFVAASVILLIIPGPTILTVISYSVAQGRRANVPLVAAVALGDSTSLVLSLLGLGALLAASAFWFAVVKVLGGLYLLYLGFKLLRAGVSPTELIASAPAESRWKLFVNTYLVTALNPKGIVFFVAFLPQFLDPAAGHAHQLWILAITFVVLAIVNSALYAVFAATARRARVVPRTTRLQPRWRFAAVSCWRMGTACAASDLNEARQRRERSLLLPGHGRLTPRTCPRSCGLTKHRCRMSRPSAMPNYSGSLR